MKRLVLGTVQFGLPYGVRFDKPMMELPEVYDLLDHAWSLGIRAFDTAEAYGTAAERLAGWLTHRGHLPSAQVVTKIIPGEDTDGNRVRRAIGRFHGAASCTLLSHGFVDDERWEALRGSTEAAGAAAGQSVYEAAEVNRAVALRGISRVQAPANVFDDRAIHARGGCPVPLDLRSAFLQGVLVQDPAQADARVPGGGALARAVRRSAADTGGDAAELLIASVLRRARDTDRVVVGIDRLDQLEVLPNAAVRLEEDSTSVDRFTADLANTLNGIDERILDPRRWKDMDS